MKYPTRLSTPATLVAIATVGATMTAACGGGGVALEELSGALVDKVCGLQVECGEYPDVQSCRELQFLGFDEAGVRSDIDAKIVIYDEQAAGRCLDSYDAILSCERVFNQEALEKVFAECGAVFVGTVAAGGVCTDALQCSGEASCETDCSEQCCEGLCVPDPVEPERAAIGESCIDRECGFDAFCTTDTEVCAAKVAVGGACDQFGACVDRAVCKSDIGGSEGTCVALANEGEACDQALFFSCLRADNFCDPGTSVCVKSSDIGEACLGFDTCRGYADCIDETCVAKGRLGEACVDDDSGADCLAGAECRGGSCVAESEIADYCPLGG